MYVDDLADACVFLAKNYDSIEPINVGSGLEISIKFCFSYQTNSWLQRKSYF